MELSHTRSIAPASSNSLPQLMRRHPLLFYFLMAFGFTWAYQGVTLVVMHLPFTWFWNLPGPFVGPTLAAFFMVAVTEGRTGILHLLRRFVLWRVGIPWYLLVLIGVPALMLIAFLILPGAISAFHLPGLSFWPAFLIGYLFQFVVGGPLGEEPGWRGFALPRLQQRLGPLGGTLLLAVLWALWHLPLYLLPNGYGMISHGLAYSLTSFLAFTVAAIALSVLFTWVFNNTQGSLLLAILLHTSIDAPAGLLLFPSLQLDYLQLRVSIALIFSVVAVLLILVSRGRLSYERYVRETTPPAPEAVVEQEPVTSRDDA